MTLRECARIQTFPDDFNFVIPKNENKTKFSVSPSAGYKLVGNADEISPEELGEKYNHLLINNENVELGFKLFRDVFMFTNKRLILVDVQGITGSKIEYRSLPYKNISRFSLETAGTFDLDAELKIWISSENLPTVSKKFNKNIEMKDVSFSYPGHDKNVLSNIDLIVKKGEFIGIVGETGSGKSTLLHLLLGLLLPKEGAVLIDEKYPANSHKWHSKIGYAAQNFHLIDGSIADNIAFGVPERKRDVKRINKVVKDAQIDRFVKALPNGIDTEIGEKGALVSGGERQRIALARALYQQPDVLMLDEATSALDLSTEKSIMDSVIKLKKKDLTIIAVTHRLDTLKAADRIIVIENGRIKEDIKNSKKASVKKNKGKSK